MKVVIDIDENVFTRLFDNGIEDYVIVNDDLFAIAKSIRNCTPLPKGHGGLIDINELITKLEAWDYKANGIPNYAWKCIKDAQAIIEADKVESENEESH